MTPLYQGSYVITESTDPCYIETARSGLSHQNLSLDSEGLNWAKRLAALQLQIKTNLNSLSIHLHMYQRSSVSTFGFPLSSTLRGFSLFEFDDFIPAHLSSQLYAHKLIRLI